MCAHTHAHTHTCTHTLALTLHTHTHTHAHIHAHTHTHTHAHTHLHSHCTHTHTHAHIHAHTHTHTHRNLKDQSWKMKVTQQLKTSQRLGSERSSNSCKEYYFYSRPSWDSWLIKERGYTSESASPSILALVFSFIYYG